MMTWNQVIVHNLTGTASALLCPRFLECMHLTRYCDNSAIVILHLLTRVFSYVTNRINKDFKSSHCVLIRGRTASPWGTAGRVPQGTPPRPAPPCSGAVSMRALQPGV